MCIWYNIFIQTTKSFVLTESAQKPLWHKLIHAHEHHKDENIPIQEVLFLPNLSASSQDYLEAVLELTSEGERVRSVDIADRLSVSRASVSRALGVLKTAGFIEQERYGSITLTEEGRIAACKVKERHIALRTFLVEMLGVDPVTAEQDACRMEHSISSETLQKLKHFIELHRG